MTFRLHHVPWGRSFRVLWLIEELRLEDRFGPLEILRHRIGDPAMRAGGLPAVSPAVRIPALELDGLAMSESGAIVEWLCETQGPDLMRIPGHPERAAFLQWLHYAETQAGLIENLNLAHLFLRPPARPDPTHVKLLTLRLKGTLAGLEARLEGEWLLPSGFSAADIMYGFNMFAAPFYVRLDPFPRLAAWKARMEAMPSFRRAAAREGEQDFYARDFYPVPEA